MNDDYIFINNERHLKENKMRQFLTINYDLFLNIILLLSNILSHFVAIQSITWTPSDYPFPDSPSALSLTRSRKRSTHSSERSTCSREQSDWWHFGVTTKPLECHPFWTPFMRDVSFLGTSLAEMRIPTWKQPKCFYWKKQTIKNRKPNLCKVFLKRHY